MPNHPMQRWSLIALAALAALGLAACNPSDADPPPSGDGVALRVVVDGPGRVSTGTQPLVCTTDCTWSVPDDTAIEIDALPSAGFVFVGWSGDCAVLPNPCTNAFEDGDTVTARFARHALRLELIGDGEGVFSIGAAVTATCAADCALGMDQPLALSITYGAQGTTGTTLGDWTGPCNAATVQAGYCEVAVAGATTVSKTWRHPPVAVDDGYTTFRGTPLVVAALEGVLANDEDTPDDALTATLVDGVSHGTLELAADGAFAYTPAPGFVGSDGFSYRVTDAFGSSDTADVVIDVVNRAPVAFDDAYLATNGQPLVVAAPGVLQNDVDPDGDPLTATLVDGVSHGTLELAADGSFRYTASGNFVGTDTFTYRAFDGDLTSAVATVTIDVQNGGGFPVRPPFAEGLRRP